ncbi:MAG TPA: hypothetical protein VKA95_10755 [Nitrososphaeraceae archaeon]|nr:hypothetical protein [Nitrososphaeraceae archaeon]
MAGTIQYRKPFSFKKGYSKLIPSGAVSTQLVRMPWQVPVQKPGVLRKVLISNPVGLAGTLAIWDQDLSNTTPPTAGSAGAALLPLGFGLSVLSGSANQTTVYTADQLPEIPFYSGMSSQSTQPGVTVAFEVEYI